MTTSIEKFWDVRWREHLEARARLGLPTDIPRLAEYLPAITPAQADAERYERRAEAFVRDFFAL